MEVVPAILNNIKEELENIPISKKFNFDNDNNDDITRKISAMSPIEDFFKMMTNKKEDLVSEAISEMQTIIT